jgi:hypothetical protein
MHVTVALELLQQMFRGFATTFRILQERLSNYSSGKRDVGQ